MARKIAEDPGRREHPDRPRRDNALFEVRTLTVLVLSTVAGWLAHHEGGWPAALTVGIAAAMGLHQLLHR